MIEPIKLNSLASEVFDRVVDAITSGEFEPGQKISESHLARELGISRGPIREALQRLEGRLVQREPRIGVRVVEFGEKELRQLFYLREAIEGMAARLAATNASDDWIATTRTLLHSHGQLVKDSHIYRQKSVDEDFHFAIARASGCPNIERLLLSEVYYQLRIHRLKSSTRPGRATEALNEHIEIYSAIAAREPDRAEDMMRKHVRSARASTLALL